jgi:outer membrane protein insertion porin family
MSVTVDGNRIYGTAQIISAAGLTTGQLASAKELEAARERLMRTGAFGSVGFNFSPTADNRGIQANLQVAEIAQVYPLRFEELGVEASALEAWLKGKDILFTGKLAGTEVRLTQYTAWVEEYLATKKISGKVRGSLSADRPGELVALFRPATAAPSVAFVRFQGNKVIGATDLANTMAGVAVGIPYGEPRFRHLLQTSIVPLYEAKGHLRVSFPKLTVERSKEVDGIVVTVEVNEGEPYKLGDVTTSGVASADDLIKEGKFKPDETVNFDEVEAGVERIRKRIRANGYLRVATQMERKIDDAKKTVNLNVAVTPGPQYTFGALTLQGLDLHSEPVIRKRWVLKPGQPFRDGYPDAFLNRIREDGVFEDLGKTKADVKVDDTTRVVNVTLFFAGQPPEQKKRAFP